MIAYLDTPADAYQYRERSCNVIRGARQKINSDGHKSNGH
jgi:hypothetical protein